MKIILSFLVLNNFNLYNIDGSFDAPDYHKIFLIELVKFNSQWSRLKMNIAHIFFALEYFHFVKRSQPSRIEIIFGFMSISR